MIKCHRNFRGNGTGEVGVKIETSFHLAHISDQPMLPLVLPQVTVLESPQTLIARNKLSSGRGGQACNVLPSIII
jgi:hypothetical protein